METIRSVTIIDMFLEESQENCNLYSQYCGWCSANGYESVGIRRFQKLINEEILIGERQIYSASKDMLVNDNRWFYLKHNIYEEGGRCLLDIDGSTEEVIRKDRVWFFKHHYCECGCGRNIPVNANETINRFYNRHHKKTERAPKRYHKNNSYDTVFSPRHGKHIAVHRHVMETYLGRMLGSDEHVHHVNMDKEDNSIGNLHLCNNKTHSSYHFKTWKLISELYKCGLIKFDPDIGYYMSAELMSFAYD